MPRSDGGDLKEDEGGPAPGREGGVGAGREGVREARLYDIGGDSR